MVGWCEHHVAVVLLVRENHRLQHVHHLSDVGHAYAVCVAVEHVEREGCNESVTHGVLLIEMPWDGAGFLVPPGSPFVNEQSDFLLGVFLVHYGFVLLDDVFYAEALAQCPVIVIAIEFGSGPLASCPSAHGVVVQADAVHAVAHLIHEYFGPVVVVVAGSTGNLIELVAVVVAAVGGVASVEVCIIVGTHASAASPAFIAHAEEFHIP